MKPRRAKDTRLSPYSKRGGRELGKGDGTGRAGQVHIAPTRQRRAPKLVKGLLSPEIRADQLEICRRNSTESPLLRLPQELLDQIFSYVVGPQYVHIISRSEEHRWWNPQLKRMLPKLDWKASGGPSTFLFALNLPLVCRQIYHTAVLLPYKRFIFDFRNSQVRNTWMVWSVPAQRGVIRIIIARSEWIEDVVAGIIEPFSKTFARLEILVIDPRLRETLKQALAEKEREDLLIVSQRTDLLEKLE